MFFGDFFLFLRFFKKDFRMIFSEGACIRDLESGDLLHNPYQLKGIYLTNKCIIYIPISISPRTAMFSSFINLD